MLKLKELRFSNIGRFVETQTIDFTILGSLVQVDAINTNTGGSSGSGKSTIFHSLDYLLGLNDTPASVLQSRLTKDGINISADFDWNGVPITISRSKSKGLVIDLPGESISGSSKLAEEKLAQIIGMPASLFGQILHKKQKSGGFFLNLTPQKTYEFLSDCLNLNEFRDKTVILDKRIKDLSGRLDFVRNKLSSEESAILATSKSIELIGVVPECNVSESEIAAIKARLDHATMEYHAAETEWKQKLSELESRRPKITSTPFDRSLLELNEKAIQSLYGKIEELKEEERARQKSLSILIYEKKEEISKLRMAVLDGSKALAEAKSTAEKVKKIKDSLCYTCEQTWVTDKAKGELSALMNLIMGFKKTIDNGKTAEPLLNTAADVVAALLIESAPRVHPDIEVRTANITFLNGDVSKERDKERAHQQAEASKNRALLATYDAELEDMRTKKDNNLYSLRSVSEHLRGELNSSTGSLESYKSELERHAYTIKSLNYQKSVLEISAQALSLEFSSLTTELLLAEESKKVIKSYISRKFDDALDYIGDLATKMVRNIPNTSTATIRLSGLKETGEGKIKEQVTALIDSDGEEDIPIKSFSGGERTALDLAIDFAACDLIETQTNQGINILIIDEGFEGLSSVEIEMVIELLKTANPNKQIILVSHDPIVKQLVPDKIIVTRTGLTSTIK